MDFGVMAVIFIVLSIPNYYILKACKVNGLLAFIPIYGSYKVLSEYKGRVFLRNWGVMYIISIISYVLFSTIVSIIFYIILYPKENFIYYYSSWFGILYIFSILATIVSSVLCLVIFIMTYIVVIEKKGIRWLFVLSVIASIFCLIQLGIQEKINDISTSAYSVAEAFETFLIILFIVLYVIMVISSHGGYKKVKRGTMKVVDRLDLKTLSKEDAKKILKERKLYLLTDID